MLGARIDVIQPQIRNLIAYLLPLPDKKQTTAVVKQDKTSRLDRNHGQKSLSLKRTLLIRKGSIKYCLFGFVNLFDMFPCCCCSAMAWTRCCLGVWQKDGGRCSGWWLKAVTESFGRHIFTEVTRAREKTQLLYAGCVSFTVDWLFWNLYGSYIAPRPQLSWKKTGNFSFDNMGPLKVQKWKEVSCCSSDWCSSGVSHTQESGQKNSGFCSSCRVELQKQVRCEATRVTAPETCHQHISKHTLHLSHTEQNRKSWAPHFLWPNTAAWPHRLKWMQGIFCTIYADSACLQR